MSSPITMELLRFVGMVAVLTVSYAFNCKEYVGAGEENVFTTKYHMSGEEFVRDFLWGDRLLRITGDYEDWPIYNYWKNDDSVLERIYVNVTHITDSGETSYSNISLMDWKRSESKMIFEHILHQDDTDLSEALLIPLVILSCKDLYKDFMATTMYGLLGVNYELDEYVEFYDDTFLMFFEGETRFTFKHDPNNSVTFNPGELIYVPRGTCANIEGFGRQLSLRITWEQTRGSGDSKLVTCNPRSLYNANIKPIGNRNILKSAAPTMLKNGQLLPPIGLGTSRLHGRLHSTVMRALKLGYRLIETSQEYYGDDMRHISAESEIGRAIRESNVPRKEIMVITRIPLQKLLKNVDEALKQSLLDLKFGYLDLVVVELPFLEMDDKISLPDGFWSVWAQLENFLRDGIVHSLGVCNVKDATELRTIVQKINDSLSIVQNWFDPLRTNDEIRKICEENGIAFVGYSTLGYKRMINLKGDDGLSNPILTMESVKKNAIQLDTPPSSYVLRWAMYQGVTVTPCTSDEYHVETNLYSHQLDIPHAYMDILTPFLEVKKEDSKVEGDKNFELEDTGTVSADTKDEL